MKYKVLLTTSGLGQRLGDITKFTNKSLVRVGEKPTISYIVESYPEDVEIVVTLGHFGGHVRQFLELVYPQRKLTFVEVDKYQGPGSSLAYSILKARSSIDCPFVFHACDTIVTEVIPDPSTNWLGGCVSAERADYASFDTDSDGEVSHINYKGEIQADYSYIGLAGIHDYESFFNELQSIYEEDPDNSQLSDVAALRQMQVSVSFSVEKFSSWFDVGNVDGLHHARKNVKDNFEILDKLEESIFMFGSSFVVKFFYDETLCLNRVKRGKMLEGIVPKIIDSTANFYKYEFSKGKLLASCANETKIDELLDWADQNLWIVKQDEKFTSKCYDFYFTKTKQRIDKFTKESGVKDIPCIINGESVPAISTMLERVDVGWICDGRPVQFHGDFILDNIIYNEGKFTLLDWRQDFAGDLVKGDIYYDLAKLNHNLVFNHDIVNKELYTIDVKRDEIHCDILRSHNLVKCQKALHSFVRDHGFNPAKLDIITALIWINMAPLHHYPLSLFLFYFGKLHLYKAINELS